MVEDEYKAEKYGLVEMDIRRQGGRWLQSRRGAREAQHQRPLWLMVRRGREGGEEAGLGKARGRVGMEGGAGAGAGRAPPQPCALRYKEKSDDVMRFGSVLCHCSHG